jgi:hypothetical protein
MRLALEKIIRRPDDPDLRQAAYLLYDADHTPLEPIRIVSGYELDRLFEQYESLKEQTEQ